MSDKPKTTGAESLETEKPEAKHYVLEVQSATIRATAEAIGTEVEAPEEAEEKNDG